MNIRQIMFQSCEVAELQEREIEWPSPAPDEIVGRTIVSAACPGTELAVYQGQLQNMKFPCGAGYAGVFQVEAIGSKVTQFQMGDLAFGMCGHQSLQRGREQDMWRVPVGLAPERAVMARLMGISMSTLTTTLARPPSTVLVTGLGIVGHLAAQIFSAAGYDVIACDPSEKRRVLAMQNGIRKVFPAVPVEEAGGQSQIALCIECSGHEQAVLDACRAVRKRGEVVLIGVPWTARTKLSAHEVLYAVFHRYIVLRSGWEWEVSRYPVDFREGSLHENYRGALQWLLDGRIRVDNLWEKHPPREVQAVYQGLLHGKSDRLTALFDWSA